MTNPVHVPSNGAMNNKQDGPMGLATTKDPVTFSAHLWSASSFGEVCTMVRIMLRSGGTIGYPRVQIDYPSVMERFTVITPERGSIILVGLCPLVNLAHLQRRAA